MTIGFAANFEKRNEIRKEMLAMAKPAIEAYSKLVSRYLELAQEIEWSFVRVDYSDPVDTAPEGGGSIKA